MKYDELFPSANTYTHHKDGNGNAVHKAAIHYPCFNCYDATRWYFMAVLGYSKYTCSEECSHVSKLIDVGNL